MNRSLKSGFINTVELADCASEIENILSLWYTQLGGICTYSKLSFTHFSHGHSFSSRISNGMIYVIMLLNLKTTVVCTFQQPKTTSKN